MSKCLFIAGTGTDVGKTFISALVVKCLRDSGLNAGYYKAAASGVELDSDGNLIDGDPIFVNNFAKINESPKNLVSYVYAQPVSPHLAAAINHKPIDFKIVERDFNRAKNKYDYLIVEGSGGVICPLNWTDENHFMLLDMVKAFNLPILLVADSGLGTINSTVLTVDYLQGRNFKINGIILNHFRDELMQVDNLKMIEELTKIKIAAKVYDNDNELKINLESLIKMFE